MGHAVSADERRTLAQNRFFYGVILDAFARHYRIPVSDAKAILCLRFLPREITVDGATVIVGGSTSGLTVAEFTTLIDRCLEHAAFRGIGIPGASDWRAA